MLTTRLVQAAGVFSGVAVTAWTFMYLFGLSMVRPGAEKLTVALPAAALVLYLIAVRRRVHPNLRWVLLEFFTGSLITFLVLQFVAIRFI